MKLRMLCLLSLTLLVFTCSKETTPDPNPNPTPNLPKEGEINLSDLKEGQKSRYKKYISTCSDIDGNFEFTGDILVVEVISENGQLLLKEYLTEDSPMFIDGSFKETYTYPVEGGGERLLIPDRLNSALFYFYGNDTIQLNPSQKVNLKQEGCSLMLNDNLFNGNDIGFVPSFEIGGVKQKEKIAVSCVPTIQLDAYLFYDQYQLYMSHTATLVWDLDGTQSSDQITGWILED